ncbi:MsnO8 family LLM class oxidoreductase [Mycetocola saprophilus]|uniref:MsnO8 family LLM class oxidoreductase n=1 Tax=Mycetocola saprophilus TaxID=76636 RepID=UPI003BEFFDDA
MGELQSPIRLSILDQSPITDHTDRDAAPAASLRLARLADGLGYDRIWFAEHHNSLSFASAAPDIMAAQALAGTTRIRVGTGGILLPLSTPHRVAETMGLLQRVHGDRVDIGLGRAAFVDPAFPEHVEQVVGLLPDEFPHTTDEPAHRVWILGVGGSSARAAGRLGTGYVQGHFLAPGSSEGGLGAYRETVGARPVAAMLAIRAVTARNSEYAEDLARAMALWRARKDLGRDAPVPSIRRALHGHWTRAEHARADGHQAGIVRGEPSVVFRRLGELARALGVNQVMINTLTSDPADREQSYALLAEESQRVLTGQRESRD